jgi:hypothetical protein
MKAIFMYFLPNIPICEVIFYISDPDTGLCNDIGGRGHLLANLQFREGRLCCGKYKVRQPLGAKGKKPKRRMNVDVVF